jgi:hypothetical protein
VLFLLISATVAHRSGKSLGIRSWIKKTIASFEGAPDGYPVTVRTQSGEKVYFEVIHLDLVDAWNPEQQKPAEFRLETDAGGQLSVSNTLDTVTALQVLKLPPFPKKPASKPDSLATPDSRRGFDPASWGTGVNPNSYFRNTETKSNAREYTPLLCRLKLTFDTGKVLEGNVTVHHDEFENRVWGKTPEGPRHMALSHIASITIEKRKGR